VCSNSIVPCPFCGLETKIFIPVLQTGKVPTGLPPSVACPNAVRREGFFCGGGEPIAQVAAEQPATEVWREWPFTIVANIEQGTDAWREWRHNGIGASDASTIMGENRFKSSAQLLQEKRGPARDFGQNAAMARGTELEPEARLLYVAQTGRDVRPACLQSTRYYWLRASLDGLAVSYDAVVEIKCGQSAYRTASQTRSVPDYYYGQVQHILAVTGFDSLDFWCYWPGYPPLLIPVPRNVAYIERLLNRELEFWNLVQRNVSSSPVGSAQDLTDDQIRSVGRRQNDDMATKLYHEGDQDMAMSLDDARSYIADPRFKLINPETGLRFTPATLEAFIKAKQLQKKIESARPNEPQTQIPSPEAEQHPIPNSVVEIPASHKHKRMEFAIGTRFVLTTKQCETPIGQELVGLLIEIERDGFVTEQGVRRLNEWLESKADSKITAILFLLDISREALSCGKLTNNAAFEIQLAIERILPKHIREPIVGKRREVEKNLPASEKTIAHIKELGGNPPPGITRWEGFDLEESLSDPATENQIAYIRRLGGNPSPTIQFQEASDLIEKLLCSTKATQNQLDYIRSLGGNPSPGLSRADVDEIIPQLQQKYQESLAKQQSPSPRQIMVLRFWNRMDLEQSSKWEVEQWLTQFYDEDPHRRAAWETFKLENSDDGSQRDPSWVMLGAGERYLNKTG